MYHKIAVIAQEKLTKFMNGAKAMGFYPDPDGSHDEQIHCRLAFDDAVTYPQNWEARLNALVGDLDGSWA